MNRCEACNGKGYVTMAVSGRLTPPCAHCNGTGRGHVHAWELRGVLKLSPCTAVRECKGCGELQATLDDNLSPFPREYRAVADVSWSACTDWEIKEVQNRQVRK